MNNIKGPLFKGCWQHQWRLDDKVTLVYGRQDSNHWLQFPGLAEFSISPDARDIHCYPFTAVPEPTLRHLLLDQVLPRCMAQQGYLLLHAGAVRTPVGLILLTGSSGAGKSTLAGYLHQAGWPALSDDCMLIEEKQERAVATPSYGGVRLWPDSQEFLFPNHEAKLEMAHYSTKQRIVLDEPAEAEKVAAICLLAPPDPQQVDARVTLQPVSKRDGYMELLKQTFQLDVTDARKVAHHAQSLTRVVQNISLYELCIPRNYQELAEARLMILETILNDSADS